MSALDTTSILRIKPLITSAVFMSALSSTGRTRIDGLFWRASFTTCLMCAGNLLITWQGRPSSLLVFWTWLSHCSPKTPKSISCRASSRFSSSRSTASMNFSRMSSKKSSSLLVPSFLSSYSIVRAFVVITRSYTRRLTYCI